MSVIAVGGMIGLGKTSVATLLGEAFGTPVYYENVKNNKILPLFYTSSKEEQESKRYPFLLQLDFLDTRFKDIKKAVLTDNAVVDRSIYEDWYFAYTNYKLGRISSLEFNLYERLLNNMMEELEELPKKAPDVMVYLKGSFEQVLSRISKRGRDFELDPELRDYYYKLWSGYDNWVNNHYKASDIILIDMDKLDVVENKEDADYVVALVKEKLDSMNPIVTV